MNPVSIYRSLQQGARLAFVAGAAVILLATLAVGWWLLSPKEQLLFGGLKEGDAAEIVEALNEWKVPHSIVDGGTGISVPEDMMYATRMRLVSAGIPRGGAVGFELFDDADFGVTEFAQRVNYQRALQGELERTIASLPPVENARVHLTIRRPGLFVGEAEPSKASVALTLRPGETLSRQQVRGIRGLVAAAVEGLAPAQVAVLDAAGNLLAGADALAGRVVEERDDEESRVEARIQAKVSELLAQVLEEGDYRVTVDVSLDFDEVRTTRQRPMAGDAVVVRKRSTVPASDELAPPPPPDEDVEYAHGTVREEVQRAPGRVERMSVAVILPVSIDDAELERLYGLISAAAGVDEARGDRLEVSRIARGDIMDGRDADAPANTSVDRAQAMAPRIGFSPQGWPAWSKMLLLLAIGLLVGITVAVAMQKRPARLTAKEREAMLGQLRRWLDDGANPQ
jgi:flagellar M-ring protein FliF